MSSARLLSAIGMVAFTVVALAYDALFGCEHSDEIADTTSSPIPAERQPLKLKLAHSVKSCESIDTLMESHGVTSPRDGIDHACEWLPPDTEVIVIEGDPYDYQSPWVVLEIDGERRWAMSREFRE